MERSSLSIKNKRFERIYSECDGDSEKSVSIALDVSLEDKTVAEVYLRHYISPYDFLYIAGVEVKDGFKGVGIGREIISKINEYIISTDSVGILIDNASFDMDNHENIFGFYERHGWVRLLKDEERVLFFNCRDENYDKVREMFNSIFKNKKRIR